MKAILCDICELPIRGEATEIHMIRGETFHGDHGRPRLTQRASTSMRYTCAPCGSWIEAAIAHLRFNLAGPPTVGNIGTTLGDW